MRTHVCVCVCVAYMKIYNFDGYVLNFFFVIFTIFVGFNAKCSDLLKFHMEESETVYGVSETARTQTRIQRLCVCKCFVLRRVDDDTGTMWGLATTKRKKNK